MLSFLFIANKKLINRESFVLIHNSYARKTNKCKQCIKTHLIKTRVRDDNRRWFFP